MRAIFPASFDPITNGHLDVATRASHLFDELILAVYDKPAKSVLLSIDERQHLAQAATTHLRNVRVEAFSGLMVTFARHIGASVVVRGLRSTADFESEHQQATANGELAPELEQVYLFGRGSSAFISSTLIKEIARLGGDIRPFVPQVVADRLGQQRE